MLSPGEWKKQARWAKSPASKLYAEAAEARERVAELLGLIAAVPHDPACGMGGVHGAFCREISAAVERGRAEGLLPR